MYDSNKVLEDFKKKFESFTQEEKLAYIKELGFVFHKRETDIDSKSNNVTDISTSKNTNKKRVIRLKKKK